MCCRQQTEYAGDDDMFFVGGVSEAPTPVQVLEQVPGEQVLPAGDSDEQKQDGNGSVNMNSMTSTSHV